MPYYRATYEGYVEGEFPNVEAAKEAMIEGLHPDYRDNYGRSPADMIGIEEFDGEKEEWGNPKEKNDEYARRD